MKSCRVDLAGGFEAADMARRPEVFVGPLEPEEAERLVKITRTARDRVRLRRVGIVQASSQGRSAAEATAMFAASAQYAREVIRAFDEQGQLVRSSVRRHEPTQ
jgi:hypothetical protein